MATTTPEPLEAAHRSGWLLVVAGALSVLAGVLALVYPDITLLALGLIAGINVLLLGILSLVEAVAGDRPTGARALAGVLGVLGVLAGVVMMRRPGETLLVLLLALGLWLVIEGIVECIAALTQPADRGFRLVAGVVDLILGILILALPKVGLGTLAVLAALAFLVRGAFAIWAGLHARRLARA
jgi:uncharacterized membrane protein HdeD (DUF308 family)